MDYKERYNAALERAKERYSACSAPALLEYIFPELKESEDGKNKRISKEITQFLKQNNGWNREWLAWLEKQGEPEDKGEISDGYHTFNELYRYRMLYNAAFFNLLPKELVHKSKKHHDGKECFGGGWFIVMANLPTGQISNHYELKDWDLFQIPEKDVADEWDGHTPQEAAERLHKYLLEKQGEQKPYGQRKECENCQFNYAGECKGLCKMKRDEQKPADEDEPKFRPGDIVQYITDSTDRRRIEEIDTLCNMYHTDSSPIMFEVEDEWKVVVNAEDVEQESVDKVDFEKKELKKIESKTLDPDKVIAWLNDQACQGWIEDVEVDKFIAKFKKDFKL